MYQYVLIHSHLEENIYFDVRTKTIYFNKYKMNV